MKRKFNASLIWILLILLPVLAFAQDRSFVLLASTIGPIDSGIVSVLEDGFEKETGIRVRHVGAGTGAALEIAKKGNVDLVMVHARARWRKNSSRKAMGPNGSISCTTISSSWDRLRTRPGSED